VTEALRARGTGAAFRDHGGTIKGRPGSRSAFFHGHLLSRAKVYPGMGPSISGQRARQKLSELDCGSWRRSPADRRYKSPIPGGAVRSITKLSAKKNSWASSSSGTTYSPLRTKTQPADSMAPFQRSGVGLGRKHSSGQAFPHHKAGFGRKMLGDVCHLCAEWRRMSDTRKFHRHKLPTKMNLWAVAKFARPSARKRTPTRSHKRAD